MHHDIFSRRKQIIKYYNLMVSDQRDASSSKGVDGFWKMSKYNVYLKF